MGSQTATDAPGIPNPAVLREFWRLFSFHLFPKFFASPIPAGGRDEKPGIRVRSFEMSLFNIYFPFSPDLFRASEAPPAFGSFIRSRICSFQGLFFSRNIYLTNRSAGGFDGFQLLWDHSAPGEVGNQPQNHPRRPQNSPKNAEPEDSEMF